MPQVPRYEPQVKEQALPNARVSTNAPDIPVQMPDPNVGKALKGGLEIAANFFEQQKKKADELAILDADQKLAAFETGLLYDPEKGMLNRKGKNALGIDEEVNEAWTKQLESLDEGLSGNSQRMAVRAKAQARRSDVDRTLQRHVSGEMRAYDNEVTENFVKNETAAASANYLDANRVESSIDRMQIEILKAGARNGHSKELMDHQIAATTSGTYKAVMNRMLVNGQDRSAQAYFEQKSQYLTEEDRNSLKTAILNGATLGEAQRSSVALTQKYPTIKELITSPEFLSLEPKVQEKTKDMAKERYSLIQEGEKDAKEKTFQEFGVKIEQSRNIYKVMQDPRWYELDNDQRTALKNLYEDRIQGLNRPTDTKAWLAFEDLTSGQLAAMSATELQTKFLTKFSREDKKRAEHAMEAAKRNSQNSPQLTDMFPGKDQVDGALETHYKKELKNLSRAEQDEVYSFRAQVNKQINDFEQSKFGGTRKASPEERQVIIDRIMIKKAPVKGFFRDKEKPLALIGERDEIVIPTADKNTIEKRIKEIGGQVSRSKVQRAYKAWLNGDAKLYNSILSEK